MDGFDPGYGPLVNTRVRIATWNIWARYGPWEQRFPAIVETLRMLDADILALQEVWDADGRNQAAEIADALGYEAHVFAPNLDFDGVRAGNAVVSRWPISTSEVRLLPRTAGEHADDEGEERICVFAEVDGPRGPIQMFCAHLSWRDDHSAIRQAQVVEIGRLVREHRPRTFPPVLCGDLNAEPHSDEIRMLTGYAASPVRGVVFRDAWIESGGDRAAGFTADAVNPWYGPVLQRDQRIDYVLVGQPRLGAVGNVVNARLAGNEPVDGCWPSDHFAVVAELRY
jgi:endonuclease/exonuclease/phosphatase family metal-dependent hydrolase